MVRPSCKGIRVAERRGINSDGLCTHVAGGVGPAAPVAGAGRGVERPRGRPDDRLVVRSEKGRCLYSRTRFGSASPDQSLRLSPGDRVGVRALQVLPAGGDAAAGAGAPDASGAARVVRVGALQ